MIAAAVWGGSFARRPRTAVLQAVGTSPEKHPEERKPTLVPLVGRIAAGGPILADQVIEDVIPLPPQLVGEGDFIILRVVGD